jgi:signal transduction histidine kinase
VDRVARQHGGTARVTDSPTGGARLEIRLPG